jgi:hypothetical protein
MTDEKRKEEFMKRFDDIKNPLIEKYGLFLYFLAEDVLNISHMEKQCEAVGYRTNRLKFEHSYSIYSEIFDGSGKLIGVISNQGLPSIEFYKRKRKFAEPLKNHVDVIKPIKGVHRILDWHTVRGKYHCLAGGETVLHFMPLNITDEDMQKFLSKTNLLDKVEKFKEDERKKLENDSIQRKSN